MALETIDLVVQFPGKPEPTLKNISMTVPDGSFAVLVGASGGRQVDPAALSSGA